MKSPFKATVFLLLLLFFPAPASPASRVIVFDAVTSVQAPVFIRIQTRGTVFSAGGLIVEIEVDGKRKGTVLTGADGFGYLKYTPAGPGLLAITARSGETSGRGRLLSVNRNDPVLVVEIDGPIRRLPSLTATVNGAGESLQALSEVFRIVYLAGMFGPVVDRAWLASVKMPEAVVLPGDAKSLLRRLKKKEINVVAVVGRKSLLEAAENMVPHRFGFDSEDQNPGVASWAALEKKLSQLYGSGGP